MGIEMVRSAKCRGCTTGGPAVQGGRTRERRVPQDGSEKKRYFSYGCRISPPASISSGRHRPAGVHAKQLNFFLEKQPALAALVR